MRSIAIFHSHPTKCTDRDDSTRAITVERIPLFFTRFRSCVAARLRRPLVPHVQQGWIFTYRVQSHSDLQPFVVLFTTVWLQVIDKLLGFSNRTRDVRVFGAEYFFDGITDHTLQGVQCCALARDQRMTSIDNVTRDGEIAIRSATRVHLHATLVAYRT